MRRSEFLTETKDFRQFKVGMLMEKDVISCRPDDTGRHIASQLTRFNFGSLPVMEENGTLIGLVSEFDLLNVLMEGQELDRVKARDIMSGEVKFVHPDTPVVEIIRLLNKDHLIRVPVVEDGKLKGIVARRDLLFGYIKATAHYWP